MTDQRVTRGTYPKLLSELVCPSCKGQYKIGWYLDTWHLRGLFLATGVPSSSESNSGIPAASQLRAPTYCTCLTMTFGFTNGTTFEILYPMILMITLQVSISHAHHVKPGISPLLSEMSHPYKLRNLPNQTPDLLPRFNSHTPTWQSATNSTGIYTVYTQGCGHASTSLHFFSTCHPTIRYNH